MAPMAAVQFELSRRFQVPARQLWDELVDWPAHGAWIPVTTIEGGPGDPSAVGYTFTGWTGIRPVALEDRMRVTRCDWDEAAQTGTCDVEKLGPVLGGTAGFTVRGESDGSVLDWREDVTVPHLPGFLSSIAAFIGRAGFAMALRRLDKAMARSLRG
jgi:hypothetical protein